MGWAFIQTELRTSHATVQSLRTSGTIGRRGYDSTPGPSFQRRFIRGENRPAWPQLRRVVPGALPRILREAQQNQHSRIAGVSSGSTATPDGGTAAGRRSFSGPSFSP
jgi:hypothetical protein